MPCMGRMKENKRQKDESSQALGLPCPVLHALHCAMLAADCGASTRPTNDIQLLDALCYREAGQNASLEGSFPCDELFWGLFNAFGAARTRREALCSSISSLPSAVLGSRGLVDTLPLLGTRGVGRQRSNPTKYLGKKQQKNNQIFSSLKNK